jgi:hypothetical protein
MSITILPLPFTQSDLDAETVVGLQNMLQQYRIQAYTILHMIQDTINAKNTPLVAPVISPNGGSFGTAQTVTITAPVGATIYYTTDGNDPTSASTVYSAPITVSANGEVKAIAAQTNFITSSVAEAVFIVTR